MARNSGCRHAPTPPLPHSGSGAPAFEWAFSWNAPLPVIDPSLNRVPEIDKQTEEQIAPPLNAYLLLEQQPQLLQQNVRYHINKQEESQGVRRGNACLTKNLVERVLLRLALVSDKYRASDNNSDAALCHRFNHLLDAGRVNIELLTKDIDGYALDGELDNDSGKELKEVAPAVSAWAARWRIRQFQFIGGAPVTVYRELRRMADHETAVGLSVEFASVHDAADCGKWAEYVNAQGGPFVRRDDLVVRTYYEPAETPNDYGEDVIRIRGVFSPPVGIDTPIITRTTEWKFVPARAADLAVDLKGAPAPSRSSVNNCTASPERLKNKQPPEPPPPPENLNFEQLTEKERRLLLRRIRGTSPERVKNPYAAVAEGFALPDEGDYLPPIRAKQPDPDSLARWREQIHQEQQQRALAYFYLGDIQDATADRPAGANEGIGTLRRPLSPQERRIESFAESIGFSLDASILKAAAKGATVIVDGKRYRARADGCLYLQPTPAATPSALTRLTALWKRQVSEKERLVGNHLRREAAK